MRKDYRCRDCLVYAGVDRVRSLAVSVYLRQEARTLRYRMACRMHGMGNVSSVALVHTVASGDRMYAERWPSSLCRLVQPETTDINLLDGRCQGTLVRDGMQDAWDGLVSSVGVTQWLPLWTALSVTSGT